MRQPGGRLIMIERLREHLDWHLRRMRAARAAAAERSLRPGSDGLQWLTVTHLAVQALEAVLAEGVAPDHQALDEVVADFSAAAAQAPPPEAAPPPAEPATAIESWSAAWASLSALGFPWRASAARERQVSAR